MHVITVLLGASDCSILPVFLSGFFRLYVCFRQCFKIPQSVSGMLGLWESPSLPPFTAVFLEQWAFFLLDFSFDFVKNIATTGRECHKAPLNSNLGKAYFSTG